MDITYSQVPDGIKIPISQVSTLFECVKLVYDTLSQAGNISPEQQKLYEDLKAILSQMS